MPKNKDKAFRLYSESNGEMMLVDIAEQLGVSSGTVRSWKSRDSWDDKINGATLQEATQKKQRNVAKQRKKKKKSPKKGFRKKEKETAEEPKLDISELDNSDLNEKQQLFCLYYLKYFNATKAYQKAYDCTYAAAMASSSRLLSNAKIQEQIENLKAQRLQGIFLDAKVVLQRYIDIAFADMKDFIDFGTTSSRVLNVDGEEEEQKFSYMRLRNYEDVDGTLITEMREGPHGISIKLVDQLKALEKLEKYTDLFPDMRLKFEHRRVELEEERVQILKNRDGDGTEDYNDDGFIDALQDSVSDIWDGDGDEEN